MGEWNNTAYIRCSNLDIIEQSIRHLFEKEGYYRIHKPPVRTPEDFDSMQYGNALSNPLWAVLLFQGNLQWTVIKTAPLELLCERSNESEKPRLAALSEELSCDSFQINLYDGDSLSLLEANAFGQIVVSGFNATQDDPLQFHEEQISEDHFEEDFYLLKVPDILHFIITREIDATKKSLDIGSVLCGINAEHWSNFLQTDGLIPHKDLNIPDARSLYFKRLQNNQ